MARKLKVYGGMGHIYSRGGQVRIVVATTSMKKAAELTGHPLSVIRDYFSETGNKEDVAMATAQPDTVFAETERDSGEYTEHSLDSVTTRPKPKLKPRSER